MDPALLIELPSMSTETLPLQTAEEVNEGIVHAPFELDENTMRSLQQFIDSHGFQSPPNQSPVVDQTVPQNTTTLNQDLALSLLPSRVEAKPETEEEREERAKRVKQENRERKKRWREQNKVRNKDNDLRCRVNKRANLIFGTDSSPEKKRYIEDEFNKRRYKRHGIDDSPVAEVRPQPWYSDASQFANVMMQIFTAHGVDPQDPDSKMLVEALQKDPKAFEQYLLKSAPEMVKEEEEEEEMEEQFDPGLQMVPQETGMFEGFEATDFPIIEEPILPQENIMMALHESIPMAPQDQTFVIDETAILSQPVPSPAPIPTFQVKTEEEVESIPIMPIQPRKRIILGPPAYRPAAIPNQSRTLPSKEQIRAMGFPPAISPTPR